MEKEDDFYAELPFVINGEKQYCSTCNQQIFVGDYVEKHSNDDCTAEVFICRKCLLENGFALGCKLTVIAGRRKSIATVSTIPSPPPIEDDIA